MPSERLSTILPNTTSYDGSTKKRNKCAGRFTNIHLSSSNHYFATLHWQIYQLHTSDTGASSRPLHPCEQSHNGGVEAQGVQLFNFSPP